MLQILVSPVWFACGIYLLVSPVSAQSGISQPVLAQFQSFSELKDHLRKTKKWKAKDLLVEVIETQKKLGPFMLHDMAVTNKTLCGSGGCPYLIVARKLSPQGLTLTLISSEFFGEFRLLPSESQGRFDLSVLARMSSDHQSRQTLKFNGRVYD